MDQSLFEQRGIASISRRDTCEQNLNWPTSLLEVEAVRINWNLRQEQLVPMVLQISMKNLKEQIEIMKYQFSDYMLDVHTTKIIGNK